MSVSANWSLAIVDLLVFKAQNASEKSTTCLNMNDYVCLLWLIWIILSSVSRLHLHKLSKTCWDSLELYYCRHCCSLITADIFYSSKNLRRDYSLLAKIELKSFWHSSAKRLLLLSLSHTSKPGCSLPKPVAFLFIYFLSFAGFLEAFCPSTKISHIYSGTDSEPGVLPRALDVLFSRTSGRLLTTTTGPIFKPEKYSWVRRLDLAQSAQEDAVRDQLLKLADKLKVILINSNSMWNRLAGKRTQVSIERMEKMITSECLKNLEWIISFVLRFQIFSRWFFFQHAGGSPCKQHVFLFHIYT